MFRRIVLCATLAGFAAALLLTVAQALWVTPLILDAETYEQANAVSATADLLHESEAAHESAAWQPQDGWQRTLSTAIANSALGIGCSLMLTGLFLLWAPLGAKQGVAWGLAGYLAFFVAPGLGLPPELPGTTAADLAARQYWWLGTAMATAIGLGLLFLQARWWVRCLGVVLLLVPHLVGAPPAPEVAGLAPEALQTQFRIATLAANAVFWLALGVLSASLFRRLGLQVEASAA